ncbi:hypothetical protein DP939_37270 [Spongiactinospora rosea]|uniref:Uncharacterized protein n=2 Tax=Spongiactinospora rosea TaxID=2248750 RepID=A0A366LML5_9ACTN|nr:hypothetical protein DP939_37270 [Spongiactinospora rosea]
MSARHVEGTEATMITDAEIHLEKLATELELRGFAVRLRVKEGWSPSLSVTNPKAPVLAEHILVMADAEGQVAFYFPWPMRIAPVTELITAADSVERVLAETGRPPRAVPAAH